MENQDASTTDDAIGMSHVEKLSRSPAHLTTRLGRVDTVTFAEARTRELATLMEEVSGHARGNRRVFQLLPKHMRRRTMSHDARRVPRRVREAHMREIAKFKKVNPQKKPSRKHRRRPKNLLAEYNRRQRTHVWLETHIWHAKRFAMCEKWGYKLPVRPNDKGIRPAYRACTKHCLLQDISFWCCIQLFGEENRLLEGFKKMTSPECGPTIAAKTYINGGREGSVMLYSSGKYPFEALGAVRFIWEPRPLEDLKSEGMDLKRKIWIWVHPVCHQDIVNEMVTVFLLQPVEGSNCFSEFSKELQNGGKYTKLAPKMESFYARTPLYESEDGGASMLLLKDTLVRFKLIGPTSSSVLRDALVPMSLDSSGADMNEKDAVWLKKIRGENRTLEIMKAQYDAWDKLKMQSPSNAPPNCVLGLVVRDPRFSLPKTKTNPSLQNEDSSSEASLLKLDPGTSWSPIWELSVRDEVTFTKMTEHELNKLRATQLVPGSDWSALDCDSKIPILLIQRLGLRSSCQGLGSGWDIVVPAGWAMAFWISLVYRGARVGGLREDDALSMEQGFPIFPADFPDTKAGIECSAITKNQMMEKYFKYPPNKRPNYIKLGAVAPFCCPWSQLVKKWSELVENNSKAKRRKLSSIKDDSDVEDSSTDFYVLRDYKKLKSFKSLLGHSNAAQKRSTDVKDDLDDSRCLVAVRLEMKSKGQPSPFAMICLAKPEDHSTKDLPITEEACADNQKVIRQALQKKRRQDAARRKRSARKARKEKSCNGDTVKSEKKEVPNVDPAILEKLHFPDVGERLNANSREIIGFVTDGGFSFTHGYGTGFGFVVLPALWRILTANQNQQLCLVRAPNSNTYQFARIFLPE